MYSKDLPQRTRVVTHPGTIGIGRCWQSEQACDLKQTPSHTKPIISYFIKLYLVDVQYLNTKRLYFFFCISVFAPASLS